MKGVLFGVGGFILVMFCLHFLSFILISILHKYGKCKSYGESVRALLMEDEDWRLM